MPTDPDKTPPADATLASRTQGVYERQAAAFHAQRPKGLHERAWLARFLALVRPGGSILDLGCGTGDPLGDYMTSLGYEVVGVDASRAMLEIARKRRPAGDWRLADMRALDLPDRFDGVLGWNSFFHLMPDEQRDVLVRIARHMRPGAALMLTVGPQASEETGHAGGEPVYHASLSPEEYRHRLRELDIEIVHFEFEDPDCDFQTVLVGQRKRPSE